MLTADLVHVRRRGDTLAVVPLDEEARERARGLAGAYLALAKSHVGRPRGELMDATKQVEVAPRDQRLARGLLKLVLDGCRFEEGAAADPPALRRALFALATERRRHADAHHASTRAEVLSTVAAVHGLAVDALERALYSDLPEAHLLAEATPGNANSLVDAYETAQVQAVLLRAARLRATVRSRSPAAFRTLFRKLKFLRLLHRIEPVDKGAWAGGYRVEIEGPYSLFDAVTKYGLQLALALPALTACDEWALEADLRWGPDRRALRLFLRGQRRDAPEDEPALPDEVAALLAALEAQDGPWRPSVSSAVLDLPGVGLCVPDLELVHRKSRRRVYLEVLGYWSREAVWRRVELAERGLPWPIVFAVSKRLRVSEAALTEEVPAALYVYGQVMSARAVLDRVEAAARRAP